MQREVSLVLLEGRSWPLRENILLNDEGRVTDSPEEYGLSARLTQQLYDWTEWWHSHEMRRPPSHHSGRLGWFGTCKPSSAQNSWYFSTSCPGPPARAECHRSS